MTRLDYHVAKVQGKMLLTNFLHALAWSLLVFGGVVWLTILVTRLFSIGIPRQWTLLFIGLGIAVAVAVVLALWRKPTRERAAVAIDERLGLKEKFSTALYVRPSKNDPFAAAAVRDAELTAERVHLQDKFPIRFPRASVFTFAVAVVAFLTGWLLQPMDLLGRKAQANQLKQQELREAEAKREIKQAIAKIEAAPPAVQKEEKIQMAVGELRKMLSKPVKDPTAAAKRAQDALDEVKSQTQKIKELQNTVQAMNEMQEWKELARKPIDESGPVGKAQSALAKGEFTKAIDLLNNTVKNFDKMEKKDQQKAADQMKAMAQQMKEMANNPQKQKEMEKQLQQLGANQKQAQQMVQKMQQAANGDKQAQQQLQQMANQMMQQMNNGQGPNPQQMQQAQQMLQQLQQQAQGQAQAQQLAQNAQQLAKAMQQAAGQQQGQQAQQGQPQQAQQGQPSQQGQQAGQGQQQQGNQGQQQQQAQQQMRQQMQQMQAMADAAAQQAGQGAAGQQQGGGQQPGGQEGQGAQANNQQQGQQAGGAEGADFQRGDPNQRGGEGQGGGPGQASGKRPDPREAPFDIKQELSRSDTIAKGKILASNFVKASALKGESKAQLQEVVESAETEATDEVDHTRVSRQAREAVKEYNRAIAEEAAAKATEAEKK